jgi:hypothetical protein
MRARARLSSTSLPPALGFLFLLFRSAADARVSVLLKMTSIKSAGETSPASLPFSAETTLAAPESQRAIFCQ